MTRPPCTHLSGEEHVCLRLVKSPVPADQVAQLVAVSRRSHHKRSKYLRATGLPTCGSDQLMQSIQPFVHSLWPVEKCRPLLRHIERACRPPRAGRSHIIII